MYKLTKTKIENLDYLDIENTDGTSKLRLCLNQGGRIAKLVFNSIVLIPEINPSTYNDNYASALLFPFANRINDGKYKFENIEYNLKCNEESNNNAIHGLVYDERFEYIDGDFTSEYGKITLEHKNYGTVKGFPFAFTIKVQYTLDNNGLGIKLKVTNNSAKSFPFTLGWHPYFLSSELDMSSINFKSKTKYLLDHQMIVSGKTATYENMPYALKDVKLDDGYQLDSNKVEFVTPQYRMTMTSSSKENFLQLYTPNQPNLIAIEPMTGICDSFNNGIGLQILEPLRSFNTDWDLVINSLQST